jgi:nucleotide-binding universal stress UspA family protein
MKLIKKILVATDFSSASDNVVDSAVKMATAFNSDVAVIHVLPKTTGNEKTNELLYNLAKPQLDAVNEKISSKGVSTLDPILEFGDFSDRIIHASEKIGAGLIFAGAGEKLKNEVPQLGSNALKIIKKSNKPVFIVKNNSPFSISKILCPVDFSPQSKRALKNAVTLANKFKAKLIVLSVYDVSYLNPIKNNVKMEEEIAVLQKDCENQLDDFLSDFTLTHLDVIREVKQGEAAEEILKTIKEHEVDLLMMGTTGKSGITRILLGSVTEKVIREIPCAFITFKSEDAITLELETGLRNIEHHYDVAQKLFQEGFFEESIEEYNKCLHINFMHIPSMQGLAEVYKTLKDTANENKYRSMIRQVLDQMYNEKIESEIRKYRT